MQPAKPENAVPDAARPAHNPAVKSPPADPAPRIFETDASSVRSSGHPAGWNPRIQGVPAGKRVSWSRCPRILMGQRSLRHGKSRRFCPIVSKIVHQSCVSLEFSENCSVACTSLVLLW